MSEQISWLKKWQHHIVRAHGTNFELHIKNSNELKSIFPNMGRLGIGDMPYAFNRLGTNRLYVNSNRVENLTECQLFFIVNHEIGHMSLSPIYSMGAHREALAIIYQPNRNDPTNTLEYYRYPTGIYKDIIANTNTDLYNNLYSDLLINTTIAKHHYYKNLENGKYSILYNEGLLDFYGDIFHSFNNATPKRTISSDAWWIDISAQVSQRELGMDYALHDKLHVLDTIKFKTSDLNRNKHDINVSIFVDYLIRNVFNDVNLNYYNSEVDYREEFNLSLPNKPIYDGNMIHPVVV